MALWTWIEISKAVLDVRKMAAGKITEDSILQKLRQIPQNSGCAREVAGVAPVMPLINEIRPYLPLKNNKLGTYELAGQNQISCHLACLF